MQNFLVLALAAAASAANFDVQVGLSGDTYTPDAVTAAAGDTVTFKFVGGFHDVVVGDHSKPCTPNGKGFASRQYSGTAAGRQTFIVTVNDTNPVYFYCSVGKHCGGGMAGAINPVANQTLTSYRAAGKGKTGVPPTNPRAPYGGITRP